MIGRILLPWGKSQHPVADDLFHAPYLRHKPGVIIFTSSWQIIETKFATVLTDAHNISYMLAVRCPFDPLYGTH